MPVLMSEAVSNARGDALEAAIGATAILKIRAGAPPASCGAPDAGTVLLTLTLPFDWMATASGGTKVLAGTWQGPAAATGTAGHFRLYASDGVTCHLQGSVGVSLGGGDLVLTDLSLTNGQVVTITSFAISEGPDPPPSALPAAPYAYYGANLLKARAVALPRADRPQLFIISDMLRGPQTGEYTETGIDPLTLACGIETEALLGMNTLEIVIFGAINPTAAALAADWGITRFWRAQYSPPTYWSWEPASTPEAIAAWATTLATRTTVDLGLPLDQVALIAIADEPGWYYPRTLTGSGGPSGASPGLLDTPAGLTMFRDYLAAKGFTPADFGGTVWTDVLPGLYSVATTLAGRRRYVWTARFVADSFGDAMALYTTALKAAFNADVLTQSNIHHRWYLPSHGRTIFNNDDAGPDAAAAAPDLHYMGRTASVGALWTQDWTYNVEAQVWSLKGDVMKSAAALSGITFGGYFIGLRMEAAMPTGGRYKALALLSRGAKVLTWYVYGPAETFAGNGWSNNDAVYAQVADANRLIARAEDLLYPGQPVATRVAIVMPISAFLWDIRPPDVDTTAQPLFDHDPWGIHFALMHAGFMVDCVSEDDLVAELANYSLVYVTAPNLAAAVQTALASWIAAGGVAWFAPGSASADEYNQPSTMLNAARGITVQTMPRVMRNEATGPYFDITMLNVAVNGTVLVAPGVDLYSRQTERLTVTTATTLATYVDDGTPAIVYKATGSGYAISSGVWVGAEYFNGPLGPLRDDVTHLPTAYRTRVRTLLTSLATVAGIAKAVTLDRAMVEAQVMTSAGGVAVTLLNWDDTNPIAALTVAVHNCPTITRAVLADTRAEVAFTQVGSTVTVTLPLATVDVLKLYA